MQGKQGGGHRGLKTKIHEAQEDTMNPYYCGLQRILIEWNDRVDTRATKVRLRCALGHLS